MLVDLPTLAPIVTAAIFGSAVMAHPVGQAVTQDISDYGADGVFSRRLRR